jgi:hypothetical protein
MSLQAQPIPPIPELTVRIAHAAFRKGNAYMQMRDLLGTLYTDDQFVDLYPADGQPAYAPALMNRPLESDRTPQRAVIASDNAFLSGAIYPENQWFLNVLLSVLYPVNKNR